MTDTTTLDTTPDSEELPELVESERIGSDGTAEDSPLKTRVLLPLLVPIFSVLIVAVLVLNISRVLLAGDEDAALATSIFITLAILIGGSLIAAAPRLRTSSLAMILVGVLVVVSLSGLLTLGPSLNDSEGEATGYVEPTGKPVGTVDVEALQSIKFNSTEYTAPEGIVEFNYTGATGHTLLIQDPKFDGLILDTDAGGPKNGKVELAPGEYTIYCNVGTHEAQGMKATLTVS